MDMDGASLVARRFQIHGHGRNNRSVCDWSDGRIQLQCRERSSSGMRLAMRAASAPAIDLAPAGQHRPGMKHRE